MVATTNKTVKNFNGLSMSLAVIFNRPPKIANHKTVLEHARGLRGAKHRQKRRNLTRRRMFYNLDNDEKFTVSWSGGGD
jgi:hypothetical protein